MEGQSSVSVPFRGLGSEKPRLVLLVGTGMLWCFRPLSGIRF